MYRSRLILIASAALALAPAAHAQAGPAASTTAAPAAQGGTAPALGTGEQRAGPPANATRIPEPDTIALFLMGAAGLVIGRRLSRSRRRQPDA